MKILFVASEAVPLVKVGGLGDVVGSLPVALRQLGHDVRILIPQYGHLDTVNFPLKSSLKNFRFNFLGHESAVNLNQTQAEGGVVYTLEDWRFNSGGVYGNSDLERFYFFSRAVFEILPRLEWQPDIVHTHDWLTSLLVFWQKSAGYPYGSVFTINNLAYQGLFDDNFMYSHDLARCRQNMPDGAPPFQYSFMFQALLHAGHITAVSETYSREILTPQQGEGLERILRFRKDDLTGIVNGIDYRFWNPQTDEYLAARYDNFDSQAKRKNKTALQKQVGLPVDPAVPVIGMVQRLDEQKGLDIFIKAVDSIIDQTGAQIVILGSGREYYQDTLKEISARHPGRLAAVIAYREPLAHLIYAGSDMFLLPSRFEPCGLGQMIAMRYGTIPVVRHTGGLVDTVPAFNSDLTAGSGFIFHDYTPEALFKSIAQAVDCYIYKEDLWTKAAGRISRLDFSWNVSARKYEAVYQSVMDKLSRQQ